MVQLSVNVDGQKGDQAKKLPDSVQVPIPAVPVAVKRGRCCSKTVVCVSLIGVFILLVAGAALLGVFRSRHKSWQDCFKWDDSDSGSNSGGESGGGGSHGGGSHGGGSHGGGHHGGGSHGNSTHGGHGGHGGGGHGGGSHGGGHHGGGSHGGGSHGNWTHGGHGGGGHGGRPWPHDGDGGHGGEEHDGGGRRYPGNEGDHFPDGRP